MKTINAMQQHPALASGCKWPLYVTLSELWLCPLDAIAQLQTGRRPASTNASMANNLKPLAKLGNPVPLQC
jgi:hypothetical protein